MQTYNQHMAQQAGIIANWAMSTGAGTEQIKGSDSIVFVNGVAVVRQSLVGSSCELLTLPPHNRAMFAGIQKEANLWHNERMKARADRKPYNREEILAIFKEAK